MRKKDTPFLASMATQFPVNLKVLVLCCIDSNHDEAGTRVSNGMLVGCLVWLILLQNVTLPNF